MAPPEGSHEAHSSPRLAGADALELEWARRPGVYLRIDLGDLAGTPGGASRLNIKARGLTIETLAIESGSVLRYRRFGDPAAPPLELPMAWTVEVEPEPSHRRVLEPMELRPYSSDDGEPAAAPPVIAETPMPATYTVGLSGGWRLRIAQRPPPAGFPGRLWERYVDGVRRLSHSSAERPPTLWLVVSEGDGRRLHHLFRSGTGIVVAPLS